MAPSITIAPYQQVVDKERSNMTTNTMISYKPLDSSTTAKKTVSFSCDARMKRTLHINNYTQEEIEATWFTDSELCSSRQEIDYTIELMELGNAVEIDEIHYTSRGLEGRTTKGGETRMRNKIAAWDAVMDVQESQFDAGIYNDVESIASAYIACSFTCQVSASMMGSSDEKVVRTNNSSSRSSPTTRSSRKRRQSKTNIYPSDHGFTKSTSRYQIR